MKTILTSVGSCFIKRSERQTLAISVLPDGTVEVIAPIHAELDKIQEKIGKRARWIMRQRSLFIGLSSQRPARRYCTGATHRYLGRQYILKVSKGTEPGVKLSGAYLHVTSRTTTEKSVCSLLEAWMRVRAKEQFGKRLENWCSIKQLKMPKLRLLSMHKRWGSSNPNGIITLNPELIRAPSICVDYVIAHELCHLKHPTHNKAFFRELDQQLPNWKTIKLRLESIIL